MACSAVVGTLYVCPSIVKPHDQFRFIKVSPVCTKTHGDLRLFQPIALNENFFATALRNEHFNSEEAGNWEPNNSKLRARSNSQCQTPGNRALYFRHRTERIESAWRTAGTLIRGRSSVRRAIRTYGRKETSPSAPTTSKPHVGATHESRAKRPVRARLASVQPRQRTESANARSVLPRSDGGA